MDNKNANGEGANAPFSMPTRSDYDQYKALAAAIIMQAAEDYKLGTPCDRSASKRFFLSDYFVLLSGGMDGAEFISALDKIDRRTFRKRVKAAHYRGDGSD